MLSLRAAALSSSTFPYHWRTSSPTWRASTSRVVMVLSDQNRAWPFGVLSESWVGGGVASFDSAKWH